jgi:hypothetical protein
MNQEQILGLVRHILTAVGAILTFKGIIDEGTYTALVGILLTSTASIWSLLGKRTSTLVAKAQDLLAKKG